MQGQVSLRNVAVLAESKQEGTVAAAKKAFPAGTDDLIRYSITGGDAFEARISSSIRAILFATLADQTRRNR